MTRNQGKRLLFFLMFILLCPFVLFAQLEKEGLLHLTHVQGAVYDKAGKPLADAKVELVRNGASRYSVTTDAAGGFRFDHVNGEFTLRVTEAHHSPAFRDVVVSLELARAVRGHFLYVLMGPSVCADSCSSIVTDKKEFKETVRRNSRQP